MKHLLWTIVAFLALSGGLARADDPPKADDNAPATKKEVGEAKTLGDTAWMLVSSGLVLLMVPGLALFYGGMVRKKNVLATLMQSMAPLAIVGVYWIAIGYCLAFGTTVNGLIGWNPKLLFLQGVMPDEILPNTNIPIYVHVMFQGMFAIITPALISGAVAERIRFGPYLLFLLFWVTFVYCPLAHWVWAMNWWDVGPDAGKTLVGILGRSPENGGIGALDFAGGTVVHIAAGTAGLAAILVLRKRIGFPDRVTQPNSMVLTVIGAGVLWFGWFGFNGGSALGANSQAVAAFSASQAAAAAAGLSWMLAEWIHKGKPTGLGLASGIVAGLVAVTPASGFVLIWGGLAIGFIAGFVCYGSVLMKGVFGYDDSLDAFGVHGVGGFLGAVLTGVFCFKAVNPDGGADGLLAPGGGFGQVVSQFEAAAISAVFSFFVSLILVKLIDLTIGFTTDVKSETLGLDISEHGEVGFDFGPELEGAGHHEPRASVAPPSALSRYSIVLDNVTPESVARAWSAICANNAPITPAFKAIYPNFTTVQGNRFRFRGGDPNAMREQLTTLLKSHLQNGSALKAYVEA
jgi:ammonium transporter